MAAVRQSPTAIRQWLVRLGHLCFDDFLLVDPDVLASSFILHPSSLSDWSVALNNAPHVLAHFRRSESVLTPSFCNLASDFVPPLEQIRAAQSRLVHAYAYDLLRAKAPPLYDALPWHDWDFSIVAKRFRLWQTRLLLAGDGTTVTVCRCRKSAGVYVLEPCETIASYIEQKCEKERVRRLRVLHSSLTPSLPLPSDSVDLSVVGSVPLLDTGHWQMVTREMLRISRHVLLIENSPLAPPLDQSWLRDNGFVSETVEVRSLGPRPCHWKLRSDGP